MVGSGNQTAKARRLDFRNFERLDKKAVQTFKECWNKLRRRAFARDWKGGFYSLEVTNEGSGWHLHLHALIDCRFIPADVLAQQWASIIGQDFAIVKVKDCRREDYIREVTKYAVKGSELAAWTPQQIADFVTAFDGVRTFGVFGSLYGKQKEWRDFLDEQDSENARCDCGCNTYRVMSESEAEWQDLMRTSPPARKNLRPTACNVCCCLKCRATNTRTEQKTMSETATNQPAIRFLRSRQRRRVAS